MQIHYLWRHSWMRDDSRNVRFETHVQHSIGFVQYNEFYHVELNHSSSHEIQKTSRCRHQNMHGSGHRFGLMSGRSPAVNQIRFDCRIHGKFTGLFVDLSIEWLRDLIRIRIQTSGHLLVYIVHGSEIRLTLEAFQHWPPPDSPEGDLLLAVETRPFYQTPFGHTPSGHDPPVRQVSRISVWEWGRCSRPSSRY